MTKKTRITPANLSTAQKKELKENIIKQFPNLALFSEVLEHAIEEYSKDNKYIDKLMAKATPIESVIKESGKEDLIGEIKTISPGTPEYAEIMAKFANSHKAEVERQKEIAEKAKEEMIEKGNLPPEDFVIDIPDIPLKNLQIENI